MKEVGDKFGAGELILPFVLQSAEVMKRAVARLELYLDKLEGYTKGTVVIATVFGDVHDIGKSLVNTILTNNGYSVIDLGKQVPISSILDAAVEHDATAIGLSALLVSTSKQMPACVQELHQRSLPFPVLIGGAAINRNFGLRILYPNGTESDDVYEPGVFYCKDAFEGLAKMDELIDPEAREALVAKTRDGRPAAARPARRPSPTTLRRSPTPRSAAPPAPTTPIPEPPFWGVRELDVPMDEVYRHLDTHVLFKLHWGGRGVKGEDWAKLLREDFQPRLERMWREQDYLQPQALLGYFPCNSEGNELIVWDPQDFDPAHPRELERLVFPRQPRHDRICLADFYRPVGLRARRGGPAGRHRRPAGDRADGLARGRRGVRRAAVRARSRRPDRRGDGRMAARPRAPRARDRRRPRAAATPGATPPAPSSPSWRRSSGCSTPRRSGCELSGGYAVEPEQSTLAIVAHHPQAVYFGMRSGTLPRNARQASDELIAGTEKDPTRLAGLTDEDPAGSRRDEPALAEA